MDINEFKGTLRESTAPEGLDVPLLALWHDGKGDWHAAHDLLQSENSGPGAWVHAYLHRKEGDLSNAAYWYRRAGRPTARGPLDAEWEAIAVVLLAGG